MTLLIKGGRVVNPAGISGDLDILVENDKIVAIEPEIEAPAVATVDANGYVVSPGLVDVHVHFRDPGLTYKEDIKSGAEAAKAGGFTTVVMMGNTKPTIDNVETLKYVLSKGVETGINVKSCANVTCKMKGKMLTQMEELAEAGAVGFSDDGMPILNEDIVREAMTRAKKLDMPISFHEEDPAYILSSGFNSGRASKVLNVGGADRLAEISMIKRDIELALETGAAIDIQHISTLEGVELIRQAKARGGRVYAEATPNHFTLSEDDVIRHQALAKINPPIRTAEDRAAIVMGLVDGTIDMIVTDHAPHTMAEKMKGLDEAPSGIIGLETSLGLSITHLVKTGRMTLEQLIMRMSYGPAVIYKLNAGVLKTGGQADITIFDPDEKWVVPKMFNSKAVNSPYIGESLFGKVKYTICNGNIVYSDVLKQD